MRILLTLGTSTGGVGTHVHALARDLAVNHTVAIAAPPSTVSHFSLTEIPGVTVFPCEMSTQIHFRDFFSVRRMRTIVDEFHPEVVHAHGFRAGLITLLAPSVCPTVVSWHNQAAGSGVKRFLQGLVETFIARRADLVLGASEDLAERARAVGGQNVAFAPVAAPAPVWSTEDEIDSLRAALLNGDNTRLLGLMVGRVAPQKNYPLLIETLRRLTSSPVHMVIAGAADDAELERVNALIQSTDLGKSTVTFLGPRSDVSALMQAADFYLLTSHWEARALVVQEALIAGLPIIAADVGGIPSLVEDAGILIDPASPSAPDQFAEAIDRMGGSESRATWAKRAQERGSELPDESEVSQILVTHYQDLIHP